MKTAGAETRCRAIPRHADDRPQPAGSLLRRPVLAVLITGLLSAASLDTAAFQRIRGAQVGRTEGYARLVLESDRPIRFVLSPRGRDRVLLELEDVTLGPILRGLGAEVGSDNPYIETINVRQPGSQAVILELRFRSPAQARAVTLPPSEPGASHQLVLDIYPSPALPEPAPQQASAGEELWLSARINAQGEGETALFVKTPDGKLLARREDLARWRLKSSVAIAHAGEDYVPLASLEGLSYRLDEGNQSLELQAPPALFNATQIGSTAEAAAAMPTTSGGFLNYDLFASRDDTSTLLNGLLEAGIYGNLGVATSSFLRRDLGTQAETLRLDSTWTLDRPARTASLRLGDSISRAAGWGGAVRFGGLQWSTNFATQPGLATLPLPSLTGEAVLPSTVDLYINDALRLREALPPGPFSIQDLPAVSGSGEIRMVVRDLLGREQVLTQPFYTSPRLLRPGLHDYSYEIGAVRENYGQASNDYGRLLAVGTHRLGLSPQLTGELHVELLETQQTAGIGGSALLPGLGIITAAIAGSHGENGRGELLSLGLERQGRAISVGASTQLASRYFTLLGLQPDESAPRQRSHAYASASAGRYGALGLAYTLEERRDEPEVRLLSASYNLNLGRSAYLSLSALMNLGQEPDSSVGLTYTQVLGGRSSFSAGSRQHGDEVQSQIQLQRSLPTGSGFGYRLRADTGETDSQEVGVSAQNGFGTYLLEAAQSGGQQSQRAGASGGVALVRDGVYFSRRISDSFAVVHVPDHPGVRVYADNQLVGRTGVDGSVLIPRLRAYQKNSIRIETADLPLDSTLDRLEFNAVPAFRSGLLLEFPVQRSLNATLTLLQDNGQPLPAGAVAQLNGQQFPVGERGELYLSGLSRENHLTVTWREQSCSLAITVSDSDDPLPHLGSHLCAGVRP